MEIFAILGISPQFLINFCIWGITANIIIGFMTKIIISVKFMSFNDAEKEVYTDFIMKRVEFIKKFNSPTKVILNAFAFLLPTYTLWLNTIFLLNFVRDSSVYGMMVGLKKYDQFSIFQLVQYKVSESNK